MAKIIISQDGEVLHEIHLGKDRMTIGRTSHNDIIIEHRAVSGQHALISIGLDEALLEDLGSTNGTFVNGRRIARHALKDGDKIGIATFQLTFIAARPAAPPAPEALGSLSVVKGPNAGKTLALHKPLTTLGSAGQLVVAITRQGSAYFIAHVDGDASACVNGEPLGRQTRQLADGDTLDLSGAALLFSLNAQA